MKIPSPGVRWLLAAICLAALILRFEGIDWARLHPDEVPISRWIADVAEDGYIKERVYPNGFFMMVRPVWAATRAADQACRAWRTWTGTESDFTASSPDRILFARKFNVWLGSLTCLVAFALARRVTGSNGAGLFAAACMAFSPHLIEHAHYAETDIAMIFMLTLCFWLWARVVDGSTGSRFALAALGCGFAAGTKFTLLALAILVPLHAAFHTPGHPRRSRGAQALRWGLLGLLVFGAGFALANPGVWRFDSWVTGLRQASASVYRETAGFLGLAHGDPVAAFLKHARVMVRETGVAGWGWFALAAFGAACAMRRPYRRFALAPGVFAAVYLYYFFGKAPWVRPQEVMAFQPVLALAAAVGAVACLRSARIRGSFGRRAVVALAVVLLMGPTLANGLRRASLFGWPDPRLAAQPWLRVSAPYDRVLGAEIYTDPLSQDLMADPRAVNKVERIGLKKIQAAKCDYVIRNVHAKGRGTLNPRTGLPFPPYQTNYAQFIAHSQLLKSWSSLGGDEACGQFIGSDLRLYGMRAPGGGANLALPIQQPLFVSTQGRETFFPQGQDLGAMIGVEVNRFAKEIAVGGPWDDTMPVYLVVNTLERGTELRISQPGRDIRARLAPYDVRVFPVHPRRHGLRTDEYHRMVLSTRPVRHLVQVPCFARIVAGPRQLVGVLAQLERLDLAARELPELDETAGPEVAYLAAVYGGRRETADRLRPAVERNLAVLDGYLAGEIPDLSIGGVSAHYYDEFARGRAQTIRNVTEVRLRDDRESPGWSAGYPLPFRLPPGAWRIEMDLVSLGIAPTSDVELLDERGRRLAVIPPADFAKGRVSLQLPFDGGGERGPELKFHSARPATLFVQRAELRWSVRDSLTVAAGTMRAALARHTAWEAASGGTGELRFTFGRLATVTGFRLEPDGLGAGVVLQSQTDYLPPLGVTLYQRRGDKWKRVAFAPIRSDRPIRAGETVEVAIRWAEAGIDVRSDPDRLALGIETDVQWFAGRLPVTPGDRDTIPLGQLLPGKP